MFGWIWGLTILGILIQAILLHRKKGRWPGWAIPAALAGLAAVRTVLLCTAGRPVGVAEELAGHAPAEIAVTVAAYWFLGCIPALGALVVWAFFRLHGWWAKLLLTIVFVAIFPFFMGTAHDGGSRLYGAVLYDITFLHRLPEQEGQPYRTGTEIRLLHIGESSL